MLRTSRRTCCSSSPPRRVAPPISRLSSGQMASAAGEPAPRDDCSGSKDTSLDGSRMASASSRGTTGGCLSGNGEMRAAGRFGSCSSRGAPTLHGGTAIPSLTRSATGRSSRRRARAVVTPKPRAFGTWRGLPRNGVRVRERSWGFTFRCWASTGSRVTGSLLGSLSVGRPASRNKRAEDDASATGRPSSTPQGGHPVTSCPAARRAVIAFGETTHRQVVGVEGGDREHCDPGQREGTGHGVQQADLGEVERVVEMEAAPAVFRRRSC